MMNGIEKIKARIEADAQAEIDRITETLHNAEQMVADKDKEIAELKADIESKAAAIDGAKAQTEQLQADVDNARKGLDEANTSIKEKDELIETLKAQIENQKKTIDDLKAEVKELSEKPDPMVGAGAGIPAGNGTGDAPKQDASSIKPGMTYEEIRAAVKK